MIDIRNAKVAVILLTGIMSRSRPKKGNLFVMLLFELVICKMVAK